MGSDRRGVPRAVPVLRRRGRNGSLEAALAARRLRARTNSIASSPATTPASQSCSRRSDGSSRTRARCGRSASVSPSTTRVHGAEFTEAGLRRCPVGQRLRPNARPRCGAWRSGGPRVFSVDVLGEGVDVPSVDTVLLLRPNRQRDGLHPATRARIAPGRRQAVSDGDRPDRAAAPAVPVRPSARRDRRPPARPARPQIEEGSRSFPLAVTSSSTARARRSCSRTCGMSRG